MADPTTPPATTHPTESPSQRAARAAEHPDLQAGDHDIDRAQGPSAPATPPRRPARGSASRIARAAPGAGGALDGGGPAALDLLVIHAPEDEWFVQGVLLPAVVDPGQRTRTSSELPLGELALEALAHEISASRVTVVVVSSCYVADRAAAMAGLWASHAALRDGPLVVPLLLESVDVPLHLEARVLLDLRERSRWAGALARLRRELGSDARDDDDEREELPCPYPGMRPYATSEAAHYYGREREVAELLGRLRVGERELYVVGPSGSGKSSLIAAGLLPRLGPEVCVRSLRPGAAPVERLGRALAAHEAEAGGAAPGQGVAVGWSANAVDAVDALLRATAQSTLLVFVDQLEELFTQPSEAERAAAIAALCALRAEPRVVLVCTLRADFFGHLLHSALWRDGRTLHVPLSPLRREALRVAIERPAELAGVRLEPGLVERLLADAAGEPGAMPLLQETLVQLWDRRCHRALTLGDYQAMGDGEQHGLAMVISRRADACLRALAEPEQRVARRILLRLVSLADGVADARRQQSWQALAQGEDPASFAVALEALVRQRVVLLDLPVSAGSELASVPVGARDDVLVDLSHEALLSAWGTLAHLVRERRKDEAQRRLLVAKVAEWRERSQHDTSAGLLDTVELAEAERFAARAQELDLGQVEGLVELVRASRAEREAVVRQRDEARGLLAAQYQEAGRQHLLDGKAQRALPFLVAARELGADNLALRTLFHHATLVRQEAALWCGGPVRMITSSLDGKHVAAAGRRSVKVWHVERLALVCEVAHAARVTSVSFSPDGRLLATGSEDHTATLWEVSDGGRALAVVEHPNLVLDLAFHPSGKELVTACWDGKVRRWDVRTGNPSGAPLVHQEGVTAMTPVDSSGLVATASWDRTVRLWSLERGEELERIRHGATVTVLEAERGGRALASGDASGEVQLWSVTAGRLVGEALRHDGSVRALAFSADGQRLASAGADGSVRIWRTCDGSAAAGPMRHDGDVTSVQFSRDGTRLVACGADRMARIWDPEFGGPVTAPLEHSAPVSRAVLLDDSRTAITASLDHAVRVWSVSSQSGAQVLGALDGTLLAHIFVGDRAQLAVNHDRGVALWRAGEQSARVWGLGHAGAVNSAVFDSSGAYLATTCTDGSIRVWRTALGAPLGPVLRQGATALRAVFSADGRRLAVVGGDHAVRVWEVGTGRLLGELVGHHDLILWVEFDPSGERLATASWDRSARVWDLRSGAAQQVLWHDEVVASARFSPGGERLVTASWDRSARVWDVESGQPITAPLRHGDVVTTAGFHPGGGIVLTASEDGQARLWDAAGGRAIAPAMEHTGPIRQARFGPHGARVLTASADRTASVWDAVSGKLLLPSLVHEDEVVAATFSSDGDEALTITRGGSLALWNVGADRGDLEAWQRVARCGGFELVGGVLLARSEPTSPASSRS